MAKLTIVPTPIGNLKDITFRAIEALKSCDRVIAEDTRNTGKLLLHFGIHKPMFSFFAGNEQKVLEKVLSFIGNGENLVLVSDSGTPGISDPGFILVRECIKNQIPVQCLPGPTAFVPALILSGFPLHSFVFEGFLPQKKGRLNKLMSLKNETRTMVFYESPYRIKKMLAEIKEIFGVTRLVSVSREISKIYEETIRGTADELLNHFEKIEPRGEFVVVISGNPNPIFQHSIIPY
ncbi:MAG: 16S rRNA (cytidine(1402)-2'-O)-methyltransferase [Bacteroidetes bacterium RIFCSPLOWO2_02_FULL_36_8]|nr:MAG: 16S rRNA (cytidine(1402)-2'-O)-methyltransferase [Bacteroidetes bacterium RIFCSPLOWO2_02_FULL_36_8]OFY71493.1 MAG: 16S rRNA (cytidine(1402)-2'-O)-methyltransferase [Bacteroidetes bacterium RIFCSPLOWO2_12_FULL_37_12]